MGYKLSVLILQGSDFASDMSNVTERVKLPSEEELTVPEVSLGYPYLKAGAQHLGKYCEPQNNEFILCRIEENDASKCLGEGKAVTCCTNQFFRQVKNSCAAELTTFAMCLERGGEGKLLYRMCRKTQAAFDACMKDNLNMDKPHYAYHTMAKIHDTTRPKPVEERPKWLDDPRGAYGRPDCLPKDFPKGQGDIGANHAP